MSNDQFAVFYVVNHAAFFVSHRLPLAKAVIARGWQAKLFCGRGASEVMEREAVGRLSDTDLDTVKCQFSSAGLNPLKELLGAWKVFWSVWRERPEVIHTASPKGNLIGGIVARFGRTKCLVVAVSGMGYLFTGESRGLKYIVKRIYLTVLRWIFRHPNLTVIVQNTDDSSLIQNEFRVSANRIRLIPGSGVEIEKFQDISYSTDSQTVILPARIMKDKGVEEFVAAAASLKERGCSWHFELVGAADYQSPNAINQDQLKEWVSTGAVTWRGHCEDMISVYARSGIVCLPSYREGMPKSLLEAAAAGCPVVTSDAVGCKDAIIAGETGDLVPVRNVNELADALDALINDPQRRSRYSESARLLAQSKYDLKHVVRETINIYENLLAKVV
ncbi:MAG: glycosyltransferase family 4 protein [Kordiimonadaceae bacterium]|nr:glycosyltransferase family 4 protein [Kordiimonadaceae bacterium]MBO6569320.1 glycosyltransferase family 4 protein [Kordiimonadaceae bacterium]MBO6964796.1 glycosyltransferase family 4 protein [Kordiimonadaceae bacterium]